jgi:hypothetical protein
VRNFRLEKILVRRTLFDTAVCDHPGIAAEKMGNKENVALQAISLRIINGLTKKKENAQSRRGQDGDLRVHSLVLQLYFYKGCIVSEGLSTVPTNYRASAESLPKVATP